MSSSLLPGNMLSMEELADKVSASAVLRAMQKVNLEYEPTEREKLEEVFTHPELLSRAIGLIATGSTDKEVGGVLGLSPFSVAIIRENEFVRAICDEVAVDNIERMKQGIRSLADNAISSLNTILAPESRASDKTKVAAATQVLKMALSMDGMISSKTVGAQHNTQNNVNVTNVISRESQEAYERVMKDLENITPVAQTLYNQLGGEANGE